MEENNLEKAVNKKNKINILCIILIFINFAVPIVYNIILSIINIINGYVELSDVFYFLFIILFYQTYLLIIYYFLKKKNKGHVFLPIYFFSVAIENSIIGFFSIYYGLYDAIAIINFIITFSSYILLGIYSISGFNKKYKKICAVAYFIYHITFILFIVIVCDIKTNIDIDSIDIVINVITTILLAVSLILFIINNDFKDFTKDKKSKKK